MFARDAQLGRDKTPDDFKTMGKDIVTAYDDGKADWAAFCMFPDVLAPTRMPAHFPVHSHIVKRQTTFNIIPGNTSSQGMMGVWIPDAVWTADAMLATGGIPAVVAPTSGPAHQNVNGAGLFAIVDASAANQALAADNTSILSGVPLVTEGSLPLTAQQAFGYLSKANTISNPGAPVFSIPVDLSAVSDLQVNFPQAGSTPGLEWYMTPSVTASVAHGGQRIIGAYIEFEYIGTTLSHAGTIEVGVHYHSIDHELEARTVHFMTPSEILQAPYYKRFKPVDGARCVWFPVDNNDYTFKKTNVDSTISGPGNQLGRVGNPMRLEWGINFLGFQPAQPVRVHMCTFYETIPDEKDRDLYNTSTYKGKASVQQSQQIVSAAINAGQASTASKNSWSQDIGRTINTIFDMTNKIAPGIANMIPGYSIANQANQFIRGFK